MGRKSRTLSLRGRIAVVARNSAITAILAIATRQKHCGSRRAGGCAEHHILVDVITQAQDFFGNVLLSIICNRSMSAGQRPRGDSRTGSSEKTALQRPPRPFLQKPLYSGIYICHAPTVAERTELTPGGLFSPAKHNCCRDGKQVARLQVQLNGRHRSYKALMRR